MPVEQKAATVEPVIEQASIIPQPAQPTPKVVAAPKVDSTAIKLQMAREEAVKDSLEQAAKLLAEAEKAKQDSIEKSSAKAIAAIDQPETEKVTKKRKKKRRRKESYQSFDDVRQSSLIHNSSDDDVVVPGN